ncbi:hypothetical protein [Cupriavidus sp. UGS-1]|nr:hypothetical protein [Cupriavidus sp. UGS-1]
MPRIARFLPTEIALPAALRATAGAGTRGAITATTIKTIIKTTIA